MIKIQNKNELELIQEKVAAAMNKKKDGRLDFTVDVKKKVQAIQDLWNIKCWTH